MLTARAAALLLSSSLALAQGPAITIDDVVRVKYVSDPVWSRDGKYIAFEQDDLGKVDVWAVEAATGELTRLTRSGADPADVTWLADGTSIAYREDDTLWRVALGATEREALNEDDRWPSLVVWSPNGDAWAYPSKLQIYYETVQQGHRHLGQMAETGAALAFSPDGTMLLASLSIDGKNVWQVTDLLTDQPVFRAELPFQVFGWMPDNQRLLGRRAGTFVTVDLRGQIEPVTEEPTPGFVPRLSPSGEHLLLMREDDAGWTHLWVLELASGKLSPLTRGAFEVEDAVWSPDGSRIVYVANEGALAERHLYLAAPGGGAARQLTEALPGTNVSPVWSPDGAAIALLHSGPHRVADLWVMPVDAPRDARQLTFSMPPAFGSETVVVPERVAFDGAGGARIHGWLFTPKEDGASGSRPAVVWLHDGPAEQARFGWDARRDGSIFYSFHQYLLQRGYVVLAIDYRGSTGYGGRLRDALHLKVGVDDVADAVQAAAYLRGREGVDGERIGVWGIGYGGFLTLQALGKHPGSFCAGVSIAGIVDWTRQIDVYNGRGPFVRRLGGTPERSPERYRIASPVTYVGSIDVPLLHLHGTVDREVPIWQLDRLIEGMVEHQRDFETLYYPGEPHVFRDPDVWRHALAKIERFFDRHVAKRGG